MRSNVASLLLIYVEGVVVGVVGGRAVCGLIEKNAIVSSISDIHRSMKPMPIMVKTAPISINNPAVSKRLTLVRSEIVVNDFLKKMLATITKMKSKIKLPIIAVM